MMDGYAGATAAFGAAMCWTVGSQCIEAAGHRVGSMTVNLLRLFVAIGVLTAWGAAMHGAALPGGFSNEAWGWLLVSGLIGLFAGDMCLFRAFVEIGPRAAMLIMTLNVPMTALIDWAWLGQGYDAWQWAGMLITIAGVAWVIMERSDPAVIEAAGDPPGDAAGRARRVRKVRPITMRGVVLGLGGAVGQAVGAVMSDWGMGEGDAFAATQIRMFGAVIGFAVLFTVIGRWRRVGAALRDGRAMAFTLFAGCIGTAFGVGLFLLSLHPSMGTATGVSATIVATVPILLIPFAVFVHREHVSMRAMVGAVIAVVGVAMLVWE